MSVALSCEEQIMSLPVTVYRWDDVGAPQLVNRTPSEILNIVRKCLVDGYGTKPSLGWSVIFDEPVSLSLVLRNDPVLGSGSCVKLSARGGADTAGIMLDFIPAISYTDINTPYRRGYSACVQSFLANMTKWVVIGTPVGFYIILSNTERVSAYDKREDDLCFVGDINSIIPADTGKFIALNSINTNGDDTSTSHASWSTTLAYAWYTTGKISHSSSPMKIYNADGSDNSYVYTITVPFAPYKSSSPTVLTTERLGIYTPLYVQQTNKIIIDSTLDVDGNHMFCSTVSPTLRGFLQGLLIEISPRYSSESWPVYDVINGQQHFLLRSQTTSAFTWINCEEW
jgi:hypothetical protein